MICDTSPICDRWKFERLRHFELCPLGSRHAQIPLCLRSRSPDFWYSNFSELRILDLGLFSEESDFLVSANFTNRISYPANYLDLTEGRRVPCK